MCSAKLKVWTERMVISRVWPGVFCVLPLHTFDNRAYLLLLSLIPSPYMPTRSPRGRAGAGGSQRNGLSSPVWDDELRNQRFFLCQGKGFFAFFLLSNKSVWLCHSMTRLIGLALGTCQLSMGEEDAARFDASLFDTCLIHCCKDLDKLKH